MTDENKKLDIDKLGKRTGLNVELLHRLSDEKLSHYFNRTAAASIGMAVATAALSAGLFSVAIPEFSHGALLFPIMNSILAVINAAQTGYELKDIKNNMAVGKDIQAEITKNMSAPPARNLS